MVAINNKLVHKVASKDRILSLLNVLIF